MGIKIPQLEQQVAIRPARVETPQLSNRVPAAAFGAEVAQQDQRVGEALQGFGAAVAKRIQEVQQRDEEQQVLSADTEFRLAMQGVLNNPEADEGGRSKGILNRNLGQAKGATVDFDGNYANLREDFLSRVPAARQKAALAARMDAHFASSRESVIRHESRQSEDAFKTALDSNLRQRVADAAALQDPRALLSAMDQAVGRQGEGLARLGRPEAEIGLSGELLAADMAKTAIGAQLERDPAGAMKTFAAIKGRLPESASANLQQVIDGKMLEVRRAGAWEVAGSLRHPDGTIDIARADAAVDGWLKTQGELPKDQPDQIKGWVRQQASVADAVLRDKRQSDDRAFINEAIKMARGGSPVQETVNTLLKKKGYGFDTADKYEKEHQIYALYKKDDSFYNDAIAKMTPQQKLAWDQIETMASGKWGNKEVSLPGSDLKQKVRDTFLTEMKQQVIGLPPEEMLKKADVALQKVVVSPGWLYDTKRPAFEVAAGARLQGSLRLAASNEAVRAITKDLTDSSSAATKAQSWLRANKKDESPYTILMLLQRDPSGAQSWNPPAGGAAPKPAGAPVAPKPAVPGVAVTMNDQRDLGIQWGSK